jgi:hypothetical protein
MDRKQTLERAAECVLRDRNVEHGAPENTFGVVAELWSAYMRADVKPHDVAAMLALLKIGRLSQNPAHDDNWVDLAGYAACGAELAASRGK